MEKMDNTNPAWVGSHRRDRAFGRRRSAVCPVRRGAGSL